MTLPPCNRRSAPTHWGFYYQILRAVPAHLHPMTSTSSHLAPLPPPDDPAVALPAGCSLALASGTMRLESSVLVGGAPFRAMRLSEPAGVALDELTAAGLGDDDVRARFARRLVAAGMLNASWPIGTGPSTSDVTIVIPVKDRPRELEALLTSLAGMATIVVDDGSAEPNVLQSIADRHGARFRSLPISKGPGAARNAGMAMVTTPLTCFLDSDCIVKGEWLSALLPALADPLVAAVAPRVIGAPGHGSRAAFERAASPLDLGPAPALVRPGSSVTFVPAACLVVRTSLGPSLFDERLTVGEDVDLVWRLDEAGWSIRYEPSVRVAHPARASTMGWLTQRWSYGKSASALDERHPGVAAPLGGSALTLAAWSALASGLPIAALGLMGIDTARLSRRLRPLAAHPTRSAIRLASTQSADACPTLARQVLRSYAPLLALSLLTRRGRRTTLGLTALAGLGRWFRTGRQLDPISFLAWSTAGDLAYCGGLWAGVLATRRSGALRPRIVRGLQSASRDPKITSRR